MGYFELTNRLAAAARVMTWLPEVPKDENSRSMSDFVNGMTDEQREDFELLFPDIDSVRQEAGNALDDHERSYEHTRNNSSYSY